MLMRKDGFVGVDVGSVSTNIVVIDESDKVLSSVYLRTRGRPIQTVQEGLALVSSDIGSDVEIMAAGTTGSARKLTGVIIGADVVKNEITAHAVGAVEMVPDVSTVMEIGGQDSKIIFIENGIVVDFAMNTVCAAGTGSFLDHQSARLSIPIEDFGSLALIAGDGVQIAGRCSVFAESDMIHKQQLGYPVEEIIYGLCKALVRNYLNNLAKGKKIRDPIVFQGGVAANSGIRRAFEEALDTEVTVPEHFNVMGAIGAAILAREAIENGSGDSLFKGFETAELSYSTKSFTCKGCSNNCEIVKIAANEEVLAMWGGRCGKWEVADKADAAIASS